MKKKLHAEWPKSAFTLAEMLVVVMIVLILAAAAVRGTSGVLKNLRFTNSFDKMIFMIQQARGLALTSKDSNVKTYEFIIDFTAKPMKATTFKIKKDEAKQETDRLILDDAGTLKFTAAPECVNTAAIQFDNGTGDTELICDLTTPTSFTIGLAESAPGGKSKTFSIHKAAGIPQVE